MKKLLITVNGKRYEVDVEVLEDDELIQAQPAFHPPARTVDSHFTPAVQPDAAPMPHTPAAMPAAAPPRPAAAAPRPASAPPRPGKGATTGGGDGTTLNAPINGTLLEINTEIGMDVEEKDVLFVVEAMKMKTSISSPRSGRVKSINVRVKDVVEQGQVLLTYE